MKDIALAHKTQNRARFKTKFLQENIDEVSLRDYLIKRCEIEDIRIKKRSNSIVFNKENIDISKLYDILGMVDPKEFVKPFSTKRDKVSKAAMYKAGSALTVEPFLPDDVSKAAISLYASYPLLKEGLLELLGGSFSSKVLEATAVAVSLARRDYLAANGTNAMLSLGEYIEETTVHKSDDLVRELAKPNVKEAWVQTVKESKNELKLTNVKDIKVGDIVVAGAGETLSVDGHVVEGNASINQVSMTGESEPVPKSRGDKALSGSVVVEGSIKIWAESVGEDTAVNRIKDYISSSLEEKSSAALKANKLADKLVPVTLALSGLSYLISRDFGSVASVLQADYSCALKLATPVTFKNSIAQAGHEGMIIKGAKSIESLKEADLFIFDKTGTLSYGDLEVESIKSFDDNWSEDDILNLTASAEEHYFHPVAQAVVEAAKTRGFVHIHHEEVEFIVAHGVKTIVDKKEVVIGSRHFLEDDEGIDFKPYEKNIRNCLIEGKTVLYVGYDKKLLGTIGLRDNLREDAKSVIDKLKSLGVKKVAMLTGDIEQKAKSIAGKLGIDEVFYELKPTDKSKIVKEFQKRGYKVAFVGDGINDAPALINADVGISMSKGADIAKATADISLLKDDLSAVVDLKKLSIKTLQRVDQNFNAAVGLNSAILLGATLGYLPVLATAVLHNGTTIALLTNSMSKIKLD